jgi:hypothetical protein
MTVISYPLPGGGTYHDVSLRVYNLLGQEVATLFQGEQQAGFYQVTWEVRGVASGVYVYRLDAVEERSKGSRAMKPTILLR